MIPSDQELIKLYIDTMSISEFKKWLDVPCTDKDLIAAHTHFINEGLDEKATIVFEKVCEKQLPHRVTDRNR